MRKQNFGYHDDDDEQGSAQHREFRVPWPARIIGFCFSLIDRTRFAIGRFFGGLVFNTRIVDRLAGISRFFGNCFVWMRRVVDTVILRTVLSEKAEGLVKSRQSVVVRLQEIWVRALGKIATWSDSSSFLRLIFFPIQKLFLIVRPSIDFLAQWIFTRDFRQLAFGVPVIILMIPLLFCAIMIPLRSNQAKTRHYLRSLEVAAQKKDYETVNMLHRKVSRLQTGDDQGSTIWKIAMIAANEGDYQEAYRQMRKLTPPGEPGSPDAHLWIAHAIAMGHVKVENPDVTLKHHLDCTLNVSPNNSMALSLMADHFLTQGEGEKSLELLEKIQSRSDEERLYRNVQKGLTLLQSGKSRKARQLFLESTEAYEDLAASSARLRNTGFISWAFIHEKLGNLLKAIDVLESGMERFKDDEALAAAYRATCMLAIRSVTVQVSDRFKIAKKLYDADPTNEELIMIMSAFSSNPSLKEQAIDTLQSRIESDALSIEALEQLAMSAMVRKDHQEARNLYRVVLNKDSNRPIPLNNLAWILAHDEPIELNEALKLIDQAIALDPKNPSIHATRGHILIKKEKWVEAIEELEFGLNGMPENRKAHQALVVAYAKTGQLEMASQHQQVLAQLPE